MFAELNPIQSPFLWSNPMKSMESPRVFATHPPGPGGFSVPGRVHGQHEDHGGQHSHGGHGGAKETR